MLVKIVRATPPRPEIKICFEFEQNNLLGVPNALEHYRLR